MTGIILFYTSISWSSCAIKLCTIDSTLSLYSGNVVATVLLFSSLLPQFSCLFIYISVSDAGIGILRFLIAMYVGEDS